MWQLCDSEHSHLSEMCVPLLLHCVTLPSGSDVFWKILQEEFHNSDWRVRFMAGMLRVYLTIEVYNNLPKLYIPLICFLTSGKSDCNGSIYGFHPFAE